MRNRTSLRRAVVIFYFILIPSVFAQVDISGFFDLQYQFHKNQHSEKGMRFGQFEIDLSKSLNNYFVIESAVAFNNESQKFELGAGFIEYRLWGNEEDHAVNNDLFDKSGVMVGLFDVPFGIDYKCIPSPDRKLVTAPLANEKTISCWN